MISVGEGSLLGANSGLGISLGDRCTIEAGTYVTAGAKVSYNGEVVKAGTLSGKHDLYSDVTPKPAPSRPLIGLIQSL